MDIERLISFFIDKIVLYARRPSLDVSYFFSVSLTSTFLTLFVFQIICNAIGSAISAMSFSQPVEKAEHVIYTCSFDKKKENPIFFPRDDK